MLEINHIYTIDTLSGLKQLDNNVIDCLVTSPPYYNLRKYPIDDIIISGDKNCEHEFVKNSFNQHSGRYDEKKPGIYSDKDTIADIKVTTNTCNKCGCYKGQIGLENKVENYIDSLKEIFTEVYRVLADDGTCWVNIGDKYSGSGAGTQKRNGDDFKSKCLMMIPERFALMMLDIGWILRSKIVWYKPNCLPNSCLDRFTGSYEIVYFFTKSTKYYFNQQFEDRKENLKLNIKKEFLNKGLSQNNKYENTNYGGDVSGFKKHWGNYNSNGELIGDPDKRNMRDVWVINTKPIKNNLHIAPYPSELVKRCLDAGCKPNGLVLDIFSGSGTTCVEAVKQNKNYIGFDLDSRANDFAEKRIEEVKIKIF
jgi:site-specific DNA-methyltransferase (cytosine-N4-specific)